MLCLWCKEERLELVLAGHHDLANVRVTSLYKYAEMMRRMILRAKVKGDHRALRWLVDDARSRNESRIVAANANVVLASPSSLWGRMRGRLDLAALVAHAIATDAGKPMVPAPWQLFWRLKKQALAKGRDHDPERDRTVADGRLSRRFFHLWLCQYQDALRGKDILIVDDVCTSGKTIGVIAEAISAADPRSIRALTIAASRQ